MNFDFEYLKTLISETEKMRQAVAFCECEPDECDISYIPTKNKLGVGLLWGYKFRLECINYNLKESSSPRASAKSYIKLYRRGGRTVRADKYVNGRIDVIFIGANEGGRDYLIPHFASGNPYPTYAYVSKETDGVIEEFYADDSQIVYFIYKKISDISYDYASVNYVPNGSHPVLSSEEGIFTVGEELKYQMTGKDTWCDSAFNENLQK